MTASIETAPSRSAARQLQPSLAEVLRCPSCGGRLASSAPPPFRDGELRCPAGHAFAVKDGIPLLSPTPLSQAEPMAAGFGTNDQRQRVYWESDLDHREVAHPVVAGFSRQRWAQVSQRIPMAEIRDLLDVGCGNGFSTVYAPAGLRAVGCDASLRMLARHPGPEVVMAEATTLPFADSQFDLVTCWEVLHHVAEPWRVLSEMARVARRFVVVFEPNPLNPAQFAFALADREHRWVLRYSRAYLVDQFRRAGLRCSSFERVGVIFPNKTPAWLYPWLARVPYKMPLVGISQLVVARKEAGDGVDRQASPPDPRTARA